MTDYASFKHGAVTFPLPLSGSGIGGAGASLLRDGDPALYSMLDFYKEMLETHLETRFLAETVAAGTTQITSIVAETLPLNPEAFLTEHQVRFPLLSAYRKGSTFESIGQRKHTVDSFEVAYVLPPLQAGEAERLMPTLQAVTAILDNRTEQGSDPTYTPPGGALGGNVWLASGVSTAGVTKATYGGYAPTGDLFFPTVLLEVQLKSASDVAVTTFELFNGVNINIDIEDPVQETVLSDVVQVWSRPAPTLSSASPNTGSKAGGTTVTLTGTDFVLNTTPTVTFGGLLATAVTVLSTTQVRCVTPAHDAYTSFIADVVVTNPDGQSGTLVAGFTFTTP